MILPIDSRLIGLGGPAPSSCVVGSLL